MVEKEEEKLDVPGMDSAGDEIKMALLGKESLLHQGLLNLSITTKGEYVKISMVPPEGKERLPHDVICVMDVSGSMAEEGLVKNKNGVKEGDGLSYLDLLKHASKTIIMCLNENDRFGLISYSDEAFVEFELDYMNDEGKNRVLKKLEKLVTRYTTNIWGGIFEALEMASKLQMKNQHQSILLLTDGEPNIFPPAGMIPQLEKYKKMHNGQISQINTFAIGKDIDTNLLDHYARIGQGQYCFIPCPGFIGTIFVNTISNILCTMANECTLNIEMLNGAKLVNVPGAYQIENNNVYVGEVKFGQRRDIVLKVEYPNAAKGSLPFMNVECRYFDFQSGQVKTGEVRQQMQLEEDDPFVDAEICRVNFVDYVLRAVDVMSQGKMGDAQKIVRDLKELFQLRLVELNDRLKQLEGKHNQAFFEHRYKLAIEFVTNILKDVSGEVTLAVGREESFKHWGKHFLPSLCHCHQQQLCNNFCDPGIQKYGGTLFQDIKNKAELTFIKLPAPRPSKKQTEVKPKKGKKNKQNNQKASVSDVQMQKQKSPAHSDTDEQKNQIDMANYYNAGGGCFDGGCLVRMADGSQKMVKDIHKGDQIKSQGMVIEVLSLIEIACVNNYIQMVELEGGLLITPKHPVKIGNKWFKPRELGKVQLKKCSAVFNLVLREGHTVEVNNYVCTTLGHEIKGKNVEHPYFGTNKIIQDLEKFSSFNDGFVKLNMKNFVRDSNSGSVCGITDS